MTDHRPVYEAEIKPLLDQIFSICERNGIPVIAGFQLTEDDPDAQVCVASGGVVDDATCDTLISAYRVLREKWYAIDPEFAALLAKMDAALEAAEAVHLEPE